MFAQRIGDETGHGESADARLGLGFPEATAVVAGMANGDGTAFTVDVVPREVAHLTTPHAGAELGSCFRLHGHTTTTLASAG